MMFTNIEQTSSFYLTQAATLSSLKILSTTVSQSVIFRWTKGICNTEKFSNTLDRNNLFPSFIFTNFIYFAVDTTPQFETREFNDTENKNASFELPFNALDKERMAAIVSLVIVKVGKENGKYPLTYKVVA